MGVRNPNSTNYVHPDEPNLLNLHKAMEYAPDGKPHVRVFLGSDTITISGDVNLVDKVKLWDGTDILVWDRPNNDGETAPVSMPTESHNMVFNGSTWDRMRGTINEGLLVNVSNMPTVPTEITANQGTAGDEQWKVNIGTNGEVKLVAGSAVIGKVSLVDSSGNNNDANHPVYVSGDVNATIDGVVTIAREESASTVSAFGEQYGLTITPVIQLDGIYGITTDVIQTYTNGTGASASATPQQGLFNVQSGTSQYGYGVLRSRRFMRYRPGQGALARFTAAFTPNIADTSQRAGLFNEENAIMVGWNQSPTGPKFGVLRATGGKTEIRVLTINSISSGSQTLTITLNGVAFTVTGVNTANTTVAAGLIASRVGGYTGWLVDQVDNTVVFMSNTLGAKAGTYSLTGSGTVSGTFTRQQTGVAQTENWTYQNEFIIDRLDGTKGGPSDIGKNPSGMTLHSEYLNVYQINFRWLGAGEIRFAIEDQTTGAMVFFHKIHYTNQYSLPHIAQPSFKLGYVAYSTGSTTNATVTGASMMAAIEGEIKQNELNRSAQGIKAGLNKDTCYHLLTIRNPYVTNGVAGALNGNFLLNAKEIILKNISVGVQGNDPGIVYMFYNASSFSGTHSYISQPRDNGMISTADGTMDYTVDTAVCRFVTAINGSSTYDLNPYRLTIPPGDSVSIAIQSTNALTRVSVALVFSED